MSSSSASRVRTGDQEMFPTPELGRDINFDCVYEPAEDTFLMLDALEQEVDFLRALKPSLCCEIGSGSGCNITFLANILKPQTTRCIAIDINPFANKASISTGSTNGVQIDAVRTSMVTGLNIKDKIDVLLFNPPYVPSEEIVSNLTEVEKDTEKCLEAAWAGGLDGRYWIDMILPQVSSILAPNGVFYMLVVEENKPKEIMEWARRDLGLSSSIVLDRRARNEHLSIIKFLLAK